jgi:antitoxin component YwqK of YwqJK toxin-antitoxin module
MKTLQLLVMLIAPVVMLAQQERGVKLLEDKNLIEVVYHHENGLVSQKGTYNLQGKLHGVWESFAEDGSKVASGTYENGKKNGKWFFWNNQTLKEVDYNNNSIASVQEWKEGTKLASHE